MLIANPRGHYHFLKGIAPYSSGAIADPGYEIVHVTLGEPLPWRQGFEAVEAHLRAADCKRCALCGVELRSPAPLSMQGFIEFNRGYCELLEQWNLHVGGLNPVARTHVAPLHKPPPQPVLHAFSYVVRNREVPAPTLVIAGAGELRDGVLAAEALIRRGETSAAAMREKVDYVMKVVEERLYGLGGRWDLVNTIEVYTLHSIADLVADLVLPRTGRAVRHGVRWHWARPPIVDIEFEMDMRGVRTELCL